MFKWVLFACTRESGSTISSDSRRLVSLSLSDASQNTISSDSKKSGSLYLVRTITIVLCRATCY